MPRRQQAPRRSTALSARSAATADSGPRQPHDLPALPPPPLPAALDPSASSDVVRLPLYDVLIVGAGLAGLSAGNALRHADPNLRVVVVEASDVCGGRVRTLHSFSNLRAVEAGAELIHGQHNSLMELVQRYGLETREVFVWAHGDGGPLPAHPIRGGVGLYYLGAERNLLRYDSSESDFVHLNEVLGSLDCPTAGGEEELDPSMSLADYLVMRGVSPRMVALAQASYANTLGANLRDLPLSTTSKAERQWGSDGDREFRLAPGALQHVVRVLRDPCEVWTNWPVARVVWGREPGRGAGGEPIPYHAARVYSTSGEVVRARRVVVAVPASVMKDEDITFHPQLPVRKCDAIRDTPMQPCVKILLRFRTPFWPAEMHGVICADTLVPEFWPAEGEPAEGPARRGGAQEGVLVAFATADSARRLGGMSRQGLRDAILEQLDDMFGGRAGGSEGKPNGARPATDNFLDLFVADWTSSPFVRGGYSSPAADPSTRSALAEPVAGTLFFAGEHTVGGFSTMHAAIDSGRAAARLVLESVAVGGGAGPSRSRL